MSMEQYQDEADGKGGAWKGSKVDYFGIFTLSCAPWFTATNMQLVYEIRRNYSAKKFNSLAT